MKGMILAAGKGTRLKPLTETIPKPMIPLIRKPVMEYIIEHLKSFGVDRLIVNTSHLSPVIENYFRDGHPWGVQIAYSFEGELIDGELNGKALGSAGGMKKVQDFSGFFDDTFIAICGDALIDLDISEAVTFHRMQKAIATLVLREVPFSQVHRYGVVQTDEAGRVLRFQEKPQIEEAVSNRINTGIYIFEPDIFDTIPSGREFDIGGDLLPSLVEKGKPVFGVQIPFQWVDIGSISDYWDASQSILSGKVKGYSVPGREVRPGIFTGIHLKLDLDEIEIVPPLYIGSGTAIGKGARIWGPTMIGANCMIDSGAIIRECLISDYTCIGSVAYLDKKIIFGNQCIDPTGQSINVEALDIAWVITDVRRKTELKETHKLIMELAKGVSI